MLLWFVALALAQARLPFCEWCRYEDDLDALFSWCAAQQAAGEPRVLFDEPRCHEAWRFALATRVVVDVALTDAFGAPTTLLFELAGGVHAVYHDACSDDSTDRGASYYFDLVSHQVDRALGIYRVPACQLRQFHANVLLSLPGLRDDVRKHIEADRDRCAHLRSRLYSSSHALFGLLVGLPPLASIARAPPLPLQLSAAFEAGAAPLAGAVDALELTRYLLLRYLIGDLRGPVDNRTTVQVMTATNSGGAVVMPTDLRAGQWFEGVPLTLGDAVAGRHTVLPLQCRHDTGRCESLELAALDAELRRTDVAHRDVTLARWVGGLLGGVCRFPREVAHRATALHTDSVRPGVFVAHAVKQVLPDMDEEEFAQRWAERTSYANAAVDKRVHSIHDVLQACIDQHGAADVLLENPAATERRVALEHRVSAWVRDKHARYEDATVREQHLAEYAAPRYTQGAEQRRLQEALAARQHGGGDGGSSECREFGQLTAGAHFVASNGKKIVFRLANGTLALKHSVASDAVEHKDKTMWKVYRVPEKQRRDLLYERWVLQRLARIDGIVRLHASADLSACPQQHLSAMGVVNVVDFVPHRLEALRDGEQCRALSLAVQGADMLVAFERGDAAFDSSIFMSDWKSDNFGVSADGRLMLFDVDSIEFYARSTRYLWQKYCDEEDARDVRQFKTECMQLGSFRNSMRSGEWPGELFCNTTTRLCDGYDSLSNVWGYCAAVLPAILGSEPYAHDVHASLPQRAQLVEILKQCTARERHKRPTPELLRHQLSSIHQAACA